MPIVMAPRHPRQPFPVKFFQSKTSLFHLFIFLIGFPIGIICSFYLHDFSLAVHTSISSVFHSLPPLPPPPLLPPADTDPLLMSPPPTPYVNTLSSLSSSSSSPPPPPLPPADTDPSLMSPPPLLPPADTVPSLMSPPPPPPPHVDTLSPLSSPPSPPPTSTLPPPAPLSLPNENNQSSPTSPQPISSPPQPPPSMDNLSLSPSSQPPALPPVPSPSPTPSTALLPPTASVSMQIPRMHNMSDDDLVKSVMEVSNMSTSTISNEPYKVAFMFLTPGRLPLSELWELFFKGNEGLFSIYVHTHPSYNDTIPQDSVFYDARITSQPVYWGDISMVEAERRLLANALLDPLNQRFVLLSDSCIPLFNFTTTYNYLINSNLSYINSIDDKRKSGRGRYNPQMSPDISIQDWRKGSQWFEINRDLALKIVYDQKYYNLFKAYCKPPCYNDEHYIPTLVNILYGNLNSNRSITYVDWSIAGPHPKRFVAGEVTEELLNSIRFGSTECAYNDYTTPMCVLFARKFVPNTLKPLLTFAPLLFGANR